MSNTFFKVKVKNNEVKVKYSKSVAFLRHAPKIDFKNFKSFDGSMLVNKVTKSLNRLQLKKANALAEAVVNMSDRYVAFADFVKTRQHIKHSSINFQTTNSRNKTGVVGVYLQFLFKEGKSRKYAYVTSYYVNGKRYYKYFPLSKYPTQLEAFQAAVSHRMSAIILDKNLVIKK